MNRGRLARYSLWQIRDFFMDRAIAILIIGFLWGYVLLEPLRRAMGPQWAGDRTSPVWPLTLQVSSAIVSLSVLIASLPLMRAGLEWRSGFWARPVGANLVTFYQTAFAPLRQRWVKLGYDLDLGIGIAHGYATLGAFGFEGRWDYSAIGSVVNLAARLCGEARHGQILIDRRTCAKLEDADVDPIGPLSLKGYAQPVPVFLLKHFVR